MANDEDDGPDSSGVWRVRGCLRTPCNELSITLPKSPQWTREEAQPRPVVLPLPGAEEQASRVIRVYAADSFEPFFSVDGANRTFLQGWFARPEYFGRAAHIVLDQHVQIDGYPAVFSHFRVAAKTANYQGMSVVASSPSGNLGFACVFRGEDFAAAASICDAIVKSARNPGVEPPKPRVYPQDDDPPIDPPENAPEVDPQ